MVVAKISKDKNDGACPMQCIAFDPQGTSQGRISQAEAETSAKLGEAPLSAYKASRIGAQRKGCGQTIKSDTRCEPCRLLSSDLSDFEWPEHFGSGRDLNDLNTSAEPKSHWIQNCTWEPRLPTRPANNIFPEFSHLVARSQDADEKRDSFPSSNASSTCSATLKRRAKTPINYIGQLEGLRLQRPRNPAALALDRTKTSSVELIAEQYRALLEPRPPMPSDDCPDRTPSPEQSEEDLNGPRGGHGPMQEQLWTRRQHSSNERVSRLGSLRRLGLSMDDGDTPALAMDELPSASPTTSDPSVEDTLCEGATVYVEPASSWCQWSEPPLPPASDSLSPLPEDDEVYNTDDEPPPLSRLLPSLQLAPTGRSRSVAPPDNLSLQICVDLLARDLVSAVAGQAPHYRRQSLVSSSASSTCPPPSSQSAEGLALQVWVMIEAYERLRDQLLESQVQAVSQVRDRLPTLEDMFDVWLRALYDVHDELAERARGQVQGGGSW